MNRNGKHVGRVSVLALTILLAGCGGGGSGGVSSTPNPPAGGSYSTLDQLTGNQTFQSGGIHWQVSGAGRTGQGTDAFGSGVVFAYNEASDTFTVTTPTGVVATFDASTYQAGQSTGTRDVFVKGTGASQQTLTLSRPSLSGVVMSYLVIASFFNTPTSSSWTAVGGVPTQASDVPRSGSATYTADTGANVFVGNTQYTALSTSGSTATFSANFGANSVATSVHLIGPPAAGGVAVDFGTFNGTGTISSSGPGFTGAFTATTGAGFSGAFFGPQGAEAAYTYNFIGTYTGGSMEAFGATWAKKN